MFKLMSRYIHYILSLVAVFLLPTLASAQSVADADSAYSQGDYSRAILLYDSIARQKGVSSELLYNLGNAYARGGDYGNAMVSYLRALRIDPSNSRAKANVKYIESKVSENNRAELKGKKLSLDPDAPSFFSSIRNFIVRDHLSDSWAVWAAIFFILFVACLAAYIYFRDVLIRKIGFFGGLSTLLLSIVMVL
ncbi:MAG: tetratricopeptide repeat protein, partial [Lepagella sp.]